MYQALLFNIMFWKRTDLISHFFQRFQIHFLQLCHHIMFHIANTKYDFYHLDRFEKWLIPIFSFIYKDIIENLKIIFYVGEKNVFHSRSEKSAMLNVIFLTINLL